MEAKFIHGNPMFVRYKRGSAIAAGEVVIVGDLIMIAHNEIAANEEGAMSIGPGVYRVNPDATHAVGIRVDWDDTANEIVAKDGGDLPMGYINPVTASVVDVGVEIIFMQNTIDLII